MESINKHARTEAVQVTRSDSDSVSMFLGLRRDYLKGLACGKRERFLQSILERLGETDRWLLLLRYQEEYVGFVHAKIDKDERLGWGFILEFYIAPMKRRIRLGTALFSFIAHRLQARGV